MPDGSSIAGRGTASVAPPRWLGWALAGVFAGVAACLAATLDRQGLWNDERFTVAAVMPHRTTAQPADPNIWLSKTS